MTDDPTADAGSPFAPIAPEDAMPVEPVPDAPAPKRGRRVGVIVGFVLAGLAIVGLAIFSGYLWSVHSQYVAQNQELRNTATELGDQVATSKAQAEKIQAELDDTLEQLAEAKVNISDLANSEAQAGDDRQALVDVADALQECADARQNLIDHLNESYKWTPESLRANEASLTQYCNKVIAGYKAIIND